jgi:hypothetical protein
MVTGSDGLGGPGQGELALSTRKQSPPAPPAKPMRRAVGGRPETWLELIYVVTGDWRRTWRLVILAATAALCVAAIMFVIQLHPDRWQSVLTVATVVTTAVGLGRLKRWPRPGSDADDQG